MVRITSATCSWVLQADFATGRDRKNNRRSVVHLRNVFSADIAGREDGNERRRSRCLLHVGPSLGFFALDQAHSPNNVESKFAGRFDRLHCRRAGGANIVYDDHARALLAKAFDALSGPVLLFSLAHQKAVEVAAYHRNRDHDGIGSHGKAADRLWLPSPLPDFVGKNLTRQARSFGVKSRCTAIDVVVARASGRELELTQPERLMGEQAQQIVARGRHEILRYHGESA
jgi:hypothetical protein